MCFPNASMKRVKTLNDNKSAKHKHKVLFCFEYKYLAPYRKSTINDVCNSDKLG